MVTCQYSQAPRHAISVVAEYALPEDLNPLSDFYYGCEAKRKQAWTSSGRIFFVASGSRWSYVEFADPGRQLPDGAVVTFETVARTLLEHVSGSAHACRINSTTPTLVQHLYLFGFEFVHTGHGLRAFGGIATQSAKNPLLPDASFTTVSSPDATVVAKVSHVHAPIFTVQIVAKGKHHSLRLHLDPGLGFMQRPPTQRLRLGLDVVSSDYAGCAKGARGTLSITRSSLNNSPNAPAAVRVELCGPLFAQGNYRSTAEIITG